MNRLDVRGVFVAYDVVGRNDAPVVVFSHSLGASSSMWAPQIEAFADRFRLVTVDARGHGQSDTPPGPYAIENLGEDVMAVADVLGVDRFHLVGTSMGGLVALWAAIELPERLLSIVPSNTSALIGSPEGWKTRTDAIRAGGMSAVKEAVVGRWFGAGFTDAHPDWYATIMEQFVETDPDGYIACCDMLAATDLRPRIGEISVPTTVIGGELDSSTPPAELRWIHDHVVGSEMVIIAGAAHLSNLDRAQEYNSVLRSHLERTTP